MATIDRRIYMDLKKHKDGIRKPGQKPKINEEIMKEVIDSVLNGTHLDQKITIYSPMAAKILVTAEESFPQAGKCTVAGYLIENMFQYFRYGYVWDRVAKDVPETSRYGAEDIAQVIKSIEIGLEHEELLKSVEEKIKNKEISPYITVHSPRLVASLKYLERTVPKFKKGSYAAGILEDQAIVNLGDPMNLEIFF